MDSSSSFYSTLPRNSNSHPSQSQYESNHSSNSPPELTTSSPDSSSSDGGDSNQAPKSFQSPQAAVGGGIVSLDPYFSGQKPQDFNINMPVFNGFQDLDVGQISVDGSAGGNGKGKTRTSRRISNNNDINDLQVHVNANSNLKLSDKSEASSSSDSEISIFENQEPKQHVSLGNGLFSYTKYTGGGRGNQVEQGSSSPSNTSLEDWNSNVNSYHPNSKSNWDVNSRPNEHTSALSNGSLAQSYVNQGASNCSSPNGVGARNGRNPPTTIPKLHSQPQSSMNGNGNASAVGMDLDSSSVGAENGRKDADGDEEMFESLIQEGSFDPPSLGNESMSPERNTHSLPHSGLTISTAPDRIPPSFYPSQSSAMNSRSGQRSAGTAEEGTPPLSAAPSAISSRRNSGSESNVNHLMDTSIFSTQTPSAAGTSHYTSGDEAPTPASTSRQRHNRSINSSFAASATDHGAESADPQEEATISSATPNAPSTSSTTGLTPDGQIPFSAPIESLVKPSISSLNANHAGKVQVHVHGLPLKGAKSRVETQVRMRLELVREVESGAASTSSSADSVKAWERIGSFTHLKLPPLSGSKRSQRKFQIKNVDPQKTLYVDAAVVTASPPHEKIAVCEQCAQREVRKAERRTSSKAGKPVNPNRGRSARDEDESSANEEDLIFFGIDGSLPNALDLLHEKRSQAEASRPVVFNCGDYLEFKDGEVILPTRITCYCRHHKEKVGFCIIFTMRDWQSNPVATGSTPPIMITDDHKATVKKGKEKAGEKNESAGKGKAAADGIAAKKVVKATPAATKPGKTSERGVGRRTNNSASAATSRRNSFETPQAPPQFGTRASQPFSSVLDASPGQQPKESTPPAASTSSSKKKGRAKPYDKGETTGRKRTDSESTNLVTMPRSRAGTRSGTPANASSSSSSGPAPPASPLGLIEQNEEWISFASAAGFMARTSSDSGGSMTTANAFSPMSNSSMTADAQALPPPPPQAFAPGSFHDSLSSQMQGSLSPQTLQTNLQSTPAFDLEQFLRDAQDGIPVDSSGLQQFIALNGGTNNSSNQMDIDMAGTQPQFSHSERAQPDYMQTGSSHQQLAFSSPSPQRPPPNVVSGPPQTPSASTSSAPAPRVEKLIPGEGPTTGGIEVTVLGSGFLPGLRCVFGDVQAPETKVWASNTLVCVLPPSPSPGPVVVSLKRAAPSGELVDVENFGFQTQDHPLRFFTYVDKTDRALMELALQVVGLQMTGQMQSARDVAMRVVGSGGAGSNGPSPNNGRNSTSSTPSGQSRASLPPGTDAISGLFATGRGSSQSFQNSVLSFLSLLDVDLSNESTLPEGAPRLDALRLANSQGHTLLHLAVILGFHKLVEALLARKHAAPVNARDKNGYTALHFAALHGRLTVARTLLSRGARDDLINVEGKIPLTLAKEKDQVDVEMLLAENASEKVRIQMAAQQLSQSIGSLSEEEDEEEEGESQEDEETSSQEDIDEDNISTCASQLESDSDEESSEDEKEDSIDESLDIDTSLPPSLLPASRQVVKGDQTPQASTTPQDEKKELFSSGSDEKEPKEKGKESKKSKDKEVEATSTPGTDSTLAFREWLAQAHDSVRTGHGLEWAASNLPGRRALQLLPRPNMAMNMHMPAVPVFHLALPATPRFTNLPWSSSSPPSSKGKDKDTSEESQDQEIGSSSNSNSDGTASPSGGEAWASDEARRMLNICKSIVEESALWLNPLYQPLDSSPPPTYESTLAAEAPTGHSGSEAAVENEGTPASAPEQGLQLESGEEFSSNSARASNQRRPSVASRSTWNGSSSNRMNTESYRSTAPSNGIVGPSGRSSSRPSSALSEPIESIASTSSAAVSTSFSTPSQGRRLRRINTPPKPRELKDDAMLLYFWIPALVVVVLLLLFSRSSSIFSLDELLSFIPGPIAQATRAVRGASNAAATATGNGDAGRFTQL